MMEYTKYFSVLLVFSLVNCDSCGENVHKWFSSDTKCLIGYNETFSTAVVRIDNVNAFVLTPNAKPSCITSTAQAFRSGGVIKVKVYSKTAAFGDYFAVLVYDVDKNVVGQETLPGFIDGWAEIEVTLIGQGLYDGHITLLGQASSSSEIYVQSICYIPALQEPLSEHSEFTSQDIVEQTASVRSLRIFVVWTPLTISLAVIISVAILALLSWACFALGKCQGRKKQPEVFEDIDNLPKPYLVPRVKTVYAESVTSSYGGRNNNIYSV